MNALAVSLILATLGAAPGESGDSGAAAMAENDTNTVYQCDFESATDRNYDTWPDGWKRRSGRGYPNYVNVGITRQPPVADAQPDVANQTNHYLQIDLDGGAASVYSPPADVSSVFSYMLTARLRTKGLVNSRAFISVEFLDKSGKVQQPAFNTPLTVDAREWKDVQLGPVTPADAGACSVRIGLHLHPTTKADLTGSAMFDDIRFARMPRMNLVSDKPHRVYQQGDQPVITCKVSGIRTKMPLVTFELMDRTGHLVKKAAEAIDAAGASTSSEAVFHGSATWKPEITKPGFYRLRVSMQTTGGVLQKTTTLAILTELAGTHGGEFGWSLKQDNPLALKQLPELLEAAGVHWVKLPVWYHEENHTRGEEIAQFAERLDLRQMNLIGVLDQPPAAARNSFQGDGNVPAAEAFNEAPVWRPFVDPVMTRLSLKVHWWQLGSDNDFSFVDYAGLNEKIASIKTSMERFGQSIKIGMPWRWLHKLPEAEKPSYQFLALDEGAPFTHDELAAHLHDSAGQAAKRWISMRPLAQSRYPADRRARDLILRMVAAKQQGVDAAFVPEPFDDETGVMNNDGAPGELFLPWRTSALTLAGSHYTGSIVMPNGSHNQIFSRNGEAVMVVWSDQPTREVLYLGEDVKLIDAWGRESTPGTEGHRQVIQTGPLPIFITGVNDAVMRWRIDFRFPNPQLKSVFGRNQWTAFEFVNHFSQGLGGVVEMQTPSTWGTERRRQEFKAAQGEKVNRPFVVFLKAGANTGVQPIRTDFEVRAEKTYRFSVYREMQVGLGDVTIKLNVSENRAGELVVNQIFNNNTDEEVNFNCMLFAPQRKRQRIQVLRQGRGSNQQTYIYPDAASLEGKTLWLRAEEIRGGRILNYQIKVKL